MYSDGAKEFRKARYDLLIPGDFSVPGRHETNGIAEGCVKKLSRCVRALLEQFGLEHAFWPWAGRAAASRLNPQTSG
eukprot:8671333-Alexandrium_andersonii.AAC.1